LENNNGKNKLVVGLWRTSQNYEVTTGHNRKEMIDLEEPREEKF
jgi:hypothetical protein